MDIHSPSRKMRDLVGVPTAQGFIVGFEDEMDGWGAQDAERPLPQKPAKSA